MIKNDYGHLNCPYYQERISDSVDVYFIPRKSKLKSALVYVSKGVYQGSESVQFTKIPTGAMYYLANSILTKDMINEFSKKGVMSSVEVGMSYTSFGLTTIGDSLFDCLKVLMERVATPSITEKDVDAFRADDINRAKQDDSDIVSLCKKGAIKGLYIESPMQNAFLPDERECVNIHASTLKKIQESYYVPSKTVIFISVDEDPRKTVEQVKKLRLPLNLTVQESRIDYDEDYAKVANDSIELKKDSVNSYLSYAVKFPARKNIYESYGDSVFFIYEIMMDLMFNKNADFINKMADLNAEVVDSEFVQGGEDAYIVLTFKTDNGQQVCDFLSSYLTKLDKHVSQSFFDTVREQYYAKALQKLSSPHQVVREFASSYPNHISYPSLVAHTMRLSYSIIKKFFSDVKIFKRVCCYVNSKR